MDSFIGEIRLFAGTFAPQYWAPCDGRALPVRDYEPLYSLIGNTWGGDMQMFKLPNLSGRVPIGAGKAPGMTERVLGQSGGAVEAMAEVTPHNHQFMASKEAATSADPSGLMLARVTPSGTTMGLYLKPPGADQAMADSMLPAGGGTPHANVMPSLGLGFIICLVGEYPTQN